MTTATVCQHERLDAPVRMVARCADCGEARPVTVEAAHTARKHLYRVHNDPTIGKGLLDSVTGVIGIIDKSGPLVHWAKRVALEKVRATLLEDIEKHGEHQRWLNEQWIADTLEAARQRPDQLRDEAADYGTRAHAALETVLGGMVEGDWTLTDLDVSLAVETALEWIRGQQLTPVAVETRVYSAGPYAHLRSAGTVDLVARRPDGALVVCDWKSGRHVLDSHAYQLAAYSRFYEAMWSEPVSEAWVIRLPRPDRDDAEFKAVKVADMEAAFRVYRSAAALYQSLRTATGRPRKFWED